MGQAPALLGLKDNALSETEKASIMTKF
jgi:hypothetical protein